MHSSSSARSSWSTVSVSSLFQYAVFGIVLYVLAGAPLADKFGGASGSSSSSSSSSSASLGRDGHLAHEKLENLVTPERNLTCQEHPYKGVYVLSREPLVVYIEGFLSEEESEHAVKLSEPHFTPSTVWNAGQETLDTTIRHSEKAPLPRDQTIKCIEERARKFQGWRPYTFIEKLWSQRYGTGGYYTYHYDWSAATRSSGRVSSFMVYLEANCTGGGTHFPRLPHPALGDVKSEWCRFVECPDASGIHAAPEEEEDSLLKEGVIFKPIKGNAVYWENMRTDGTGYLESWHAGLPVKSGVKIGLNVWSWWQEGYVPRTPEDGKE